MSTFQEFQMLQAFFNIVSQYDEELAQEATETILTQDAAKVKAIMLELYQLAGLEIPKEREFKKYIAKNVKRLIEKEQIQQYYTILQLRKYCLNEKDNIKAVSKSIEKYLPSIN